MLSCRGCCGEAKAGATHGASFLWCVSVGCCLCVSQASAADDKPLRGPGARTCEEFAFDLRVNLNTENTYSDVDAASFCRNEQLRVIEDFFFFASSASSFSASFSQAVLVSSGSNQYSCTTSNNSDRRTSSSLSRLTKLLKYSFWFREVRAIIVVRVQPLVKSAGQNIQSWTSMT